MVSLTLNYRCVDVFLLQCFYVRLIYLLSHAIGYRVVSRMTVCYPIMYLLYKIVLPKHAYFRVIRLNFVYQWNFGLVKIGASKFIGDDSPGLYYRRLICNPHFRSITFLIQPCDYEAIDDGTRIVRVRVVCPSIHRFIIVASVKELRNIFTFIFLNQKSTARVRICEFCDI